MKKILKYLIFFYSSLLVVEIIISLPNKKESKYSTNIFIPKKISFNNEKIYPLSGLPNKEIIFCKNNLREYVYISDKLGFNNNNKIYNNLSPKILILGDYLIHADCVKNNNYLVNLLNNKLNIVNFSYPGNGPLSNFSIYKEYSNEIKNISKIVLFFNENDDLNDLEAEFKNKILIRYFKNKLFSQNLKSKFHIIEKHTSNLARSSNQVSKKLINIFKLISLRSYTTDHLNDFSLNTYENFEKILIKLKNETTLKNIEIYIVYFPSIYNLNSFNLFLKYKFFKIEKKITSIVNNNDMKFINIKKKLINEKEIKISNLLSKERGHFNEKGYKTISNFILEEIK